MKNLFYVLICYFTFLVGCDKKEDDVEIEIRLFFEETQCANPWDALPNDNNYLSEVKTFLEAQNIKVHSIKVERFYDGPLYGGCGVMSGRRIEIVVLETNVEAAEMIGFKKNE